jgi:crotonobetainyl-CoA:carnitine CoA-transferase CaiB-like acyl-CoA transferase
MLLADFGADVIRVEQPSGGEDRFLAPLTDTREGPMYLNLNRNKRGMTLSLGHEQAAQVLIRLVRSADVIVVNLAPEVLQRLGLDYPRLSEINPGLVMAMGTAFGPDGPRADQPAFDGILQAMSGAMGLTGFPDAPVNARVPYIDYTTALHAAFGVMLALYERRETGQGSLVDVSLLASSITLMQGLMAERQATGIQRKRVGNAHFWAAPSSTFPTGDGGWIVLQTVGTSMFRRWTELVGRRDLFDDPRMADDAARSQNADVLHNVMAEWCASRRRDEALSELQAARIPCGAVHSLDEAMADPQVIARGLLQDVSVRGSKLPIKLAPAPVRLGATPPPIRTAAPLLGEHTDPVLSELGYSEEEITQLRAAGAI